MNSHSFMSHNSPIKHLSNKPFLVTARDTILPVALTVVITIIIMWIYFKVTSTPDSEKHWSSLILRTLLSTTVLAFTYEYTGLNNLTAESSMRYAKGTTLSKYTSRREAMLYECYYKLLAADPPIIGLDKSLAKIRFDILRYISTHVSIRGKISDASKISADAAYRYIDLIASTSKDKDVLNTLKELPFETLSAIDVLADRMTENIAYDIIVYGFDGYKIDGIIFHHIDPEVVKRADLRGGDIAKKLDD